jgi:hypothetical protein
MIRTVFLAAALLTTTTLPAAAVAQTAPAQEQTAQLSLSATGEVRITPDQAQVSAGVVTEARTAAEALRANSQRMQRVFSALEEAGVDARDIQTSQLNVSPVYSQPSSRDGGTRQITGYSARNTVTALVRGMESVGPAIDALFEAGANSLNGVTFSSSEAEVAETEARRRAVAELYATRDLYAEAGGFTVERLLNFSESGGYAPQPVMFSRAMAMEDAATPVSGGELVVSITVNGMWEIEG